MSGKPNGRRGRRLAGAVAGFMVLALGGAVWLGAGGQGPAAGPALTEAEQEASGWGSSVLRAFHERVVAKAPIRVANACGLGATSCFKCHNKGRRGPAPAMDDKADPWHPQHMEVNHSCDGCHKGNPRLMVEGISHKGMIADPRTSPVKTCGGCHSDEDPAKLVKRYQGVGG